MIPVDATSIEDSSLVLLQGFSCVLGRNKAAYLSGPITTGRGYLEAALRGDSEIQLASVKLQNESRLLAVADKLRAKHRFLIEPASLRVPGWTQQHYHRFWSNVLQRFVDRLYVLEDWAFSVGCATEFRWAIDFGIPVHTLEDREVSPGTGVSMLSKAIAEIEQRGAQFDDLLRVAGELKRLREEISEAQHGT
jgi:hypothetical protein